MEKLHLFVFILCLQQFVRCITDECIGGVPRCDWGPWGLWGQCDGDCGERKQWRHRGLCCDTTLSFDECLQDCNKEGSGLYESHDCIDLCSNGGTYLGYIGLNCQCRQGFTGACCDEGGVSICEWFPWEQWGSCIGHCGGGSQKRWRNMCCKPDLAHSANLCLKDCNNDWSGKFELRDCTGQCPNGGTYDGIYCQCRPGYTGICCDNDIDECESSPCQRGGTCRDKINGYECICPDKAYGVHCEQDICQPRPSDIVFILDSSVSMTEADFRKQLDFISLFVDELNIGPKDFQISVITFSYESKIEFHLHEHQTNVSLKQALNGINYRPGATFTHIALGSAIDVFEYEDTYISNRPTTRSWPVQKYVFVLTDGMSNDRKKTKEAAKVLREMAHYVIAIGIGMEVSHKELLDIATPGDVYSVDNFNSLYTIIQQLINDRCQKCYISSLSDIVFLIDESSYITKQEFQMAIDDITYLINNMEAYGTDTGPNIAINTFGEASKTNTALKFSHGKSKSELLPFLQNLIKNEGSCQEKNQCDFNITEAIKGTIQEAFIQENGGREKAKEFVVILSNGQFELAINQIGHNNVTLFVIGLGLDVNMDGLLSLVDDPNSVFLTQANEEPTNLDVIQTEFTHSFCDALDDA